ncbi:hypothetical protein A3H80_04125 [Candidatus Roizmanbacteria bacterium RIFCSPLOWO2_02_FULL_37_19]|uniref:HIT domain-containing protein n=1 Tax=Candidatus Roizmanbacteria bacterium RIFCSPHIGHO2_02_FULL_37_24 TaxID=1802037 RepID=A0A1F7GZF3_9BACT|nr:MAG: hypothetical protein A3C24_04125 [Candidatus Roizmanbacteria bacterium RIFCSPHIGHO2_02_FULL_37_24]OGK32588.1 MAG: hypothetical protein A3E10_02645 [Candidatus Roizmanbacteria bacterium RIFCSPHIGHO2_12_FULL_37_23]OGK44337.1 MAG: hypothetical protein A2956_04105 [Candidatus Roizmanbacteria bacterium RIFCSPLOWO2_01_FULL_37_57]OGK53719.1 MAG: hypothetical protein A3H80_04125 [Candidatus Roizmanbacteria bacterium RIFCSPLOWO2_02_FULL_37_19]OGK59477.1 MAG: hypothetical protein A3G65_04630 [Can
MADSENCIFCKIVAGKLPSYKVYEDELFFGFLDIVPRSKGHTLLVPKKHYRWTYDLPGEEFKKYWATALEITRAQQKALKPQWIKYFTFGEIPHAHIHIQPRYDEMKAETPIITPTIQINESEMQEIARKILDIVSHPVY